MWYNIPTMSRPEDRNTGTTRRQFTFGQLLPTLGIAAGLGFSGGLTAATWIEELTRPNPNEGKIGTGEGIGWQVDGWHVLVPKAQADRASLNTEEEIEMLLQGPSGPNQPSLSQLTVGGKRRFPLFAQGVRETRDFFILDAFPSPDHPNMPAHLFGQAVQERVVVDRQNELIPLVSYHETTQDVLHGAPPRVFSELDPRRHINQEIINDVARIVTTFDPYLPTTVFIPKSLFPEDRTSSFIASDNYVTVPSDLFVRSRFQEEGLNEGLVQVFRDIAAGIAIGRADNLQSKGNTEILALATKEIPSIFDLEFYTGAHGVAMADSSHDPAKFGAALSVLRFYSEKFIKNFTGLPNERAKDEVRETVTDIETFLKKATSWMGQEEEVFNNLLPAYSVIKAALK